MRSHFDWHLRSLRVTSGTLSMPRCTDPSLGCRGPSKSSCTPAPCSYIPCTHTSIAQTPLDSLDRGPAAHPGRPGPRYPQLM